MSQETPSLPQNNDQAGKDARAFQLSVAGTAFNYMHTYMPGVGLSADLPEGEAFNFHYKTKLVPVVATMMANLLSVLDDLLDKEEQKDEVESLFDRIKHATKELLDFDDVSLREDLDALKDLIGSVAQLPGALIADWSKIPPHVRVMVRALKTLLKEVEENGPTAVLKSTLWVMLGAVDGREILQADSLQDYRDLFLKIPLPQMLTIKEQSWMPQDGSDPCMQDWFFGYLQVGGFNTTQLRGVQPSKPEDSDIVGLDELLQKMPITDAILQAEVGDSSLTLAQAAAEKRLFVVDYAVLEDCGTTPVHGEERYLAAPIAVFYLNPQAPKGYPDLDGGVLQPIAIQLEQKHDPVQAPIFTPTDAAGANDSNHFKWAIAKYFVNVCCAIQHESVAHLGDCHLEIDPMVVAANRNLAEAHPLMVLLKPHFRFTININQSALHSLIIPGGVVATNVGPKIQDTWRLVADAHKAWRFDNNNPDVLFKRRGVDTIPDFPFRDDTQLLWQATFEWVSEYIDIYYENDAAVSADYELQNWVNEMVNPDYAGFKGFSGFVETGNPEQPLQLQSKDYLKKVIAQIIYIAGPQHASVNFAQYPLMSYMPSVAGTIYEPAPTRDTQIPDQATACKWYPPLDVGCYTFLFEYLLSGVQYDTFGHYENLEGDEGSTYFTDARVNVPLQAFQDKLADIEQTIKARNKTRPMEYPFQLPSKIPNSISI